MNKKPEGETTEADRPAVSVSKDLDFARDSVFEMFSDPKKAATWFGTPEGAVKVHFEWDLRPGGTFKIRDRSEDHGSETRWTVLELNAPERVVFKSATTLDGATTPFEALQTVTLEHLGPNKTRVTVFVKVLAAGSFPGGAGPLEQGYMGGWGQTFDILERELRSASGRR